MKTAVPTPGDILESTQCPARREQRSLSGVYGTAPAEYPTEYVANHTNDEITDTMNRVCDEVGEYDDAFLSAAARRVLDRAEW